MNRGLHVWRWIEDFVNTISSLPALGIFAAIMWVMYQGFPMLTKLNAGMGSPEKEQGQG